MVVRKWKDLNPKLQRLTVVAGALAAISAVVLLLPSGKSTGTERQSNQDVIKHVLTDRDTRTVGLESLAAAIKDIQSKVTDQSRQMKKMERDLDLAKKQQNSVPPIVNSQMERLTTQIERMKEDIEKDKDAKKDVKAAEGGTENGGQPAPGDATAGTAPAASGTSYSSQFGQASDTGFEDLTKQSPLEVFQNNKWPTTVTGSGAKSKAKASAAAPKINVVMEQKADPRQQEEKETEDSFYMPSGSIITGVLLNGLDAPTGQGARKDPFPITMRVQKEAILPNRFRADIRECFVVVSGYGDLSSERAYLRGETISCVREDGAIIEAKLNSYAVGEDGKAGIRGRLVSKQGQVIARSLMAGFLSGLSKAFDVKPVAVLDTSSTGGNTQYQKNEPNANWLQSSAASGASTALEKVADFYLKMAEGMFPVIEVDAGRQIDLIISQGAKLQFRSMGMKK